MAEHGGHQVEHIQEVGYSSYGSPNMLYQVRPTRRTSPDNGCHCRPAGMYHLSVDGWQGIRY